MIEDKVISLPHLTNEIVKGAKKTKLCSYSVAIEGWRRGLKLKWYTIDSGKFDNMITFGINPPGRLFSLESKDRIHYFFRTRGDKVSNEAVEIGSDKNETKKWLAKAGVPVPEGAKFGPDHTDDQIVYEANKLGFPLVLKPIDASLGNGVVTNIKKEAELRKALDYVRVRLGYQNVMIERYVQGEEYRVYVVGDKAIGAYNRLPANVIGDGKSTISELIEQKNAMRMKNARLFSCLIEIDEETLDFIQTAGYTLDSIPIQGEKVLLKEKTNVSAGGDPIDVTDEIPDEMKQIAINAIKAVPELNHGGVDIIVDLTRPTLDAVVIELNPTAQIGGILFPMEGKARDIPSAIVDYYFPETIGTQTDREKIYFDLNTVLEPLVNRSAQEVEVAPALVGKIYRRCYVLKGKVSSAKFHRFIKIEALKKNLSGFVNKISHDNIEIIIAGTNKQDIDGFKKSIRNYDTKIKEIQEGKWPHPVKIGFDIFENFNTDSYKNINSMLKYSEKELARLKKEHRRLKLKTDSINQSRSFKYAAVLKKVVNGVWKRS
ncbi:acylphosphatase [Amphibacillus sediminis]|uniref:acylphosphatase n=1 Tax=Amphibacillus sediminis TaxID=360185 RepID=UPI00082BAE5D|nr:acylphosphatase [Amphibacillus sediminis]